MIAPVLTLEAAILAALSSVFVLDHDVHERERLLAERQKSGDFGVQ